MTWKYTPYDPKFKPRPEHYSLYTNTNYIVGQILADLQNHLQAYFRDPTIGWTQPGGKLFKRSEIEKAKLWVEHQYQISILKNL